jgi:dihydroneopterin aldolase
VCYGELVTGIRHVVGSGHNNLAETLAERIAAMCLEDRRVHAVKVRVEKLDVFPESESVGVEIERRRP